MRIAQLFPGSGSRFYCENCARDDSLTRGLRARGHEVVLGSLYLPLSADRLSADGPPAAQAPPPVFYGAVNLYRAPSWAEIEAAEKGRAIP